MEIVFILMQILIRRSTLKLSQCSIVLSGLLTPKVKLDKVRYKKNEKLSTGYVFSNGLLKEIYLFIYNRSV